MKTGSLFVLGWKTNSIWKHSIIKTQRPCERRVSLTYRLIKTILHKDGTITEIDNPELLLNKIETEAKKIKK
jgi:hypothetical protein